MPAFTFTSPEGKSYTVNGPDGATKEQAFAILQQQIGQQTAPAQPKAPADSVLSRFGQGLADPVVGIGQKVAHAAALLPIDALKENAATYDDFAKQREADYNAPEGVDIARIAGKIASPINLAAGVRSAGLLAQAPSFGARLLGAAPVGAALSVTQPITEGDFGTESGKQAVLGALSGPVGEGVAAGVSNVVAPQITAAAKKLMGEGIRLTPGQATGGFLKTLEDKATSLPILGDAIQSARARSIDDFNRAAANRVLSPIGESVPKDMGAGRSLVEHVQGKVSDAYNALVPKLQFNVNEPQFISELQGIKQVADGLPEQQAKRFTTIMRDEVASRLKNGRLDGNDFKVAESELKRLSRQYGGSQDADQQLLGGVLDDVVSSMRDGLERANPAHAAELKSINTAFANLVRYEKAASMRGAKEGVVSPANLGAAVRSSDSSVRKRAYASGNALMQDLSDAAEGTIPSQYPDSGTAGRGLMAAGLLGAGAHFSPNALAAFLGAASLYTRPGQAALAQYLTPGVTRNALASGVRRAGIPAGATLLPLAYQSGN